MLNVELSNATKKQITFIYSQSVDTNLFNPLIFYTIMMNLQVIGRLGADAHVEANNGKPFVAFNIASDNSGPMLTAPNDDTNMDLLCPQR